MSVLYSDLDRSSVVNGHQSSVVSGNTNLEDSRTLQLAIELSMISLASSDTNLISNGNGMSNGMNGSSDHHSSQSLNSPNGLNTFSMMPSMEDRSKKSQNMTECVPVPSSEHVAEIVGRQGCKIKALRAKTNTYIKTPVRGEEPVFVVTGRKEDVAKAKREILSAAEHFSLIRASRKPALGGLAGKGTPPGPPANIPGQITIQVRVPYRVVGLVVGPKGATIKNIQQQTHTYIVTPSRDKEPVFEVTGLPENVQSARQQIEAHIALRTGNSASSAATIAVAAVAAAASNNFNTLLDESTPELLASLCKNGLGSLFGYLDPNMQNGGDTFVVNGVGGGGGGGNGGNGGMHNGGGGGGGGNGMNGGMNGNGCQMQNGGNGVNGINVNGGGHNGGGGNAMMVNGNGGNVNGIHQSSTGSSTCSSSSSSSTSSKSAIMTRPELMNIWKQLGESLDVDEGLGDSPNIWSMPPTGNNMMSRSSPSASASPTDSLLAGSSCNKRECLVCSEKEVTAALVPCGHNMFCLDCANRICTSGNDAICPVCSQTVLQAIRIIA